MAARVFAPGCVLRLFVLMYLFMYLNIDSRYCVIARESAIARFQSVAVIASVVRSKGKRREGKGIPE